MFAMPLIPILVLILLILLFFLLSPLFRRVGKGINGVSSYIKEGFTEDEQVHSGSSSSNSSDSTTNGRDIRLHDKD